MATLTVWKLDSADAADEAAATLQRLQKQQLVQVNDAAVVRWPANARRPTITLLPGLVGAGAVGGAFWGMLFGLAFFVPLLSLAISAGFGPLIASAADIGIDEKVIKELHEKITSGTSALLLLSASAVTDRVLEEMKAQPGHADVIESILTRDREAKVRGIFAPQPSPAMDDEPPSSVTTRSPAVA